MYILRERGQNIFFSCVLGGRKENKKGTERSRKILCIKHRDSFLKNKFAVLRGFVEGQSMSALF